MRGGAPGRDVAVEMHKYFPRLELLRALHLTQNAPYEICVCTPGLLFSFVRDVPNEFANGNALSHVLAHLI